MAKVKLEKILESMDSFKLNCEVSLLENEGITDLVRAQTRKDLHESFNFIKKELITGGLLEEAQTMLANTWTQAIMEDISLEDIKGYIPTGEDVDKFAKNLYNDGKSFVNETIPKYTEKEYSNLNDTLKHTQQERQSLENSQKGLIDTLNHTQQERQSLENSQKGLTDVLNKPGAKLGVMADGIMADRPIEATAGLATGAGLAGYGAYKVGQKVKRALFNK